MDRTPYSMIKKRTLTLFAVIAISVFPTQLKVGVNPAHAACGDAAGPGVDWSGCRKRNLILSGEKMAEAKFADTDMTSTNMKNAMIKSSDFTKAVLVRADLSGAEASGAVFSKATGSRVRFEGAVLEGADFSKAEISRVNFINARVVGANFAKSELNRAQFGDAQLGDNDFSFSVIARADFRGAEITGPINLTGAYTFQTRFEGVDLTGAKGLEQWQIDMSCGDRETKLPGGVTPPASWPCTVDEE